MFIGAGLCSIKSIDDRLCGLGCGLKRKMVSPFSGRKQQQTLANKKPVVVRLGWRNEQDDDEEVKKGKKNFQFCRSVVSFSGEYQFCSKFILNRTTTIHNVCPPQFFFPNSLRALVALVAVGVGIGGGDI